MISIEKKYHRYSLKIVLGILILLEALFLAFISWNMPMNDDIGNVVIIDQQIKALDDKNYFTMLTGKDKYKRVVWSYTSEVYNNRKSSSISRVKAGKDNLYIVLNKVLYCFERDTGKQKWKVEDVGLNNCIVVNSEENIYVTDYNKPGLKIINRNGEVLTELEFDENLCWPNRLDLLKDGRLKIYFKNVKNKNKVNKSEVGYDEENYRWFIIYNVNNNVFDKVGE